MRDSAILCVGQIVADVVVRPVEKLPVPGQLELVESIELVPGGCACNTACTLAKLGASVKVCGLVGNDALGDTIVHQIARDNVDISAVWVDPKIPTSAVIVVVSGDGQRSFLYRQGGNESFCMAMVPDDAMEGCGIVHVGGAMKLTALDFPELLCKARAKGCVTSMDTDWDPTGRWMSIVRPAMEHLDYLMTNEGEGARLTGLAEPAEIGRALVGMGPSTVIVKMGERGSVVVGPEGVLRVPAFGVDVVDTTCAGDAFVGGFLRGLQLGLSSSQCAALGNASGGLCATKISHRGIESLDATMAFMKAQGRPL